MTQPSAAAIRATDAILTYQQLGLPEHAVRLRYQAAIDAEFRDVVEALRGASTAFDRLARQNHAQFINGYEILSGMIGGT